NGFSALVGQLGLTDHVPEALRHRLRARVAAGSPGTADDPGAAPLPGPARLCRALEQLGPTFVKLGKVLSTRVVMLPTAYTDRLTVTRGRYRSSGAARTGPTLMRHLTAGAVVREARPYAGHARRPAADRLHGGAHAAAGRDRSGALRGDRGDGARGARHPCHRGVLTVRRGPARHGLDRSLRRELDHRAEAADA